MSCQHKTISNHQGAGLEFWLPQVGSSCAVTEHTEQLLPCPSPASSSAWLVKAAGQLCMEQCSLYLHEGKGKGWHPQSCKAPGPPSGTWASSCDSQQAQRCHSSCPTMVTNCCTTSTSFQQWGSHLPQELE